MKERLAKSLGQILKLSSSINQQGQTIDSGNDSPSGEQYDENKQNQNSMKDLDISSLLSPPPPPLWNVDILRGTYFDFEPVGNMNVSETKHSKSCERPERNHLVKNGHLNDVSTQVESKRIDTYNSERICPFPVVEFVQQQNPSSSGHVLIRLQGYPSANREFDTVGSEHSRQQPVTLVFDACIQNPPTVNM